MATIGHRLEYAAARGMMRLAQLLGPRSSDRTAQLLGAAAWHLLTSRREIARANLRATIGADWPDERVNEVSRAVFKTIARTLFEVARFPRIGPNGTNDLVVPRDMTIFEQLGRLDTGAIWVSAHYGNWELLGSWANAQGYPTDFLIGRQHNPLVDNLLNDMRRSMGVGIIPIEDALRGVLKSLRQGRNVAIAADQHAPAGSLVMDFLGRRASVARGPAMFAVKAGCPIVPILMRREAYNHHIVMVGDPIYPPDCGDRDRDIESMTRAWCDYLEQAIIRYPDQWAWTHRRWKV